ncbi:MAG: hypothetical protein WCJ07_02560 [Verrucomicrobiota bacterium]
MHEDSSRIGRAVSGKVQIEFTDRFIFPQTGKGDFVVSGNTLTQLPAAVNLFFAG